MILLVIITIILVVLLHKQLTRDSINLPGPTQWPVFGNVFHIDLEKPHETFAKWHKEYKGLYRIDQLGKTIIVAGTYESIHEVMVKRGNDFSGRIKMYRMYMWSEFNEWQDGIIICPPDTTWKLLRMTSQKHIKQFDAGLKRLENVAIEICHDMLDSFAANQGKLFEPRETIMNAIMNNLTTFLLGKKFDSGDQLFRQFFEIEQIGMELFSVAGKHTLIDLFPWLRFFGNKTHKQFQNLLEKRDALYQQMKKEVLAQNNGNGEKTILEAFLELVDEGKIEGGELRIKCAAMNMIFAGAGTSLSSFHAFVNIITHYRDVYAKLQKEVNAVLGDRSPSLDDRDRMPYMKATLFELLRYTSIVPFTVKSAVVDTGLGDLKIPKGTEILINLWAAHHDEVSWPEPFTFKPERFLDEFGNVVPVDHVNRRRLWPFGAGPRVCIGEVFAMGRLFLLMSSLIQRFEVEQPEPKVSCDPRDYSLALVLTPPDVMVKMTAREY